MRADLRGVQVEWHNGGLRMHLVGIIELGPMWGNDRNLALSLLYRLGRWEAERSGGVMDPERKGWVRKGEKGGESSSTTTRTSSRAGTPPTLGPLVTLQGPQENQQAPPLRE